MSYLLGTIVPGPGIKCKCDVYLHRTKANVRDRAAITLDADYCAPSDPDGHELLARLRTLQCTYAVHTTWSSAPGAARLRVIVPLSRLVLPLEYAPMARMLMSVLGDEKFDHTCDQPSRLMYLPAVAEIRSFRLWTNDDPWLDADFWLDLAGGPDTVQVREEVQVHTGSLTPYQRRVLVGLARKLAGCEEGNRDSLLLWSLKVAEENGMDPEISGEVLVAAGIHAGLEEEVCWEKVARVLG